MRSGWDERSIVAPEFARIAAGEGAELLSVHGRTPRAALHAACADRGVIRAVVEAVPGTPVLANGDVVSAQDAFDMLRETGAAGVMIGRGAHGQSLDLPPDPGAGRGAARRASRATPSGSPPSSVTSS